MSILQRITTDAHNAMQDLYSNWVLGDDAGKSAHLTLVVRPRFGAPALHRNQPLLDLGMTFIEINGRAYVKSVLAGSVAQRTGIMPQDAVQFAMLFRKEWDLAISDENDDGERRPSPSTVQAVDSLAAEYVLDLEAKGIRISYDELRTLLAQGLDPMQSAFLSPSTSSKTSANSWKGPPIPSTVNVCVPIDRTADDGYMGLHGDELNDSFYRPSSPFSQEMPRPVVFVFRRTRQRKSLHAYTSNLVPLFRLDDECDFATSLVQRLAPTADMDAPPPNTWEELVHDGTDWLLGRESMMPPNRLDVEDHGSPVPAEDDDQIPMDAFERERAEKVARLRSLMAAESVKIDRTDDVEAATIRGMIQKAVGLAFVRSSKVVMGVSLHAGTGLVIARLSDGTWSAPSAIGTWGLGFGIQFGVEVAEYIFILQTHEALEHFRSGASFTVGGNVGIAAAGLGREAYGAASVNGNCGNVNTVKDDEYNDNDSQEEKTPPSLAVAPIVAYAKSQGLYVGVSLEGSRIFPRDDINSRTYKFDLGRDVSANDILSGQVATPPEAEELYAALHSVEFAHEMSCLPRPPETLRVDAANSWHYDRSTLGQSVSSAGSHPSAGHPFSFLSNLTKEESHECEAFETQFKNFMYGGVSVQRLLPDKETRSGRTSKERRTLWLMLPEVGSLRLGFVSKLSDGEGAFSNKSSTQQARRDDRSRLTGLEGDLGTVGSEEVTLDSALNTKDGSTTIGNIRGGNVHLSNKHSVAMTDVTVVSQVSPVPIRFKEEDKMEHLRVISVQDVSGTSLLFLANNFREAELLVCGLKLLLERETARLGVRGGLPLRAFGGRYLEGAMSPSAARGFRDVSVPSQPVKQRRTTRSIRATASDGMSSEIFEETEESVIDAAEEHEHDDLNERRRRWGNVPGRDYMRGQAASTFETDENGFNERGVPQYIHGHTVIKEIANNVRLPLPLPLCRVLLLDSTSPVIKAWEKDRGDSGFDKTRWSFPAHSARDLEKHTSEHQMIASGTMVGAHRTSSFDRPRYGSIVRLSETHSIEADDPKKVAFTVTERNPRRGFSIRVRILIRACKENSCEANVFAELTPVGKDMSNQAAVHKAFLLVAEELKQRYADEGNGLLAGFLCVVDDMASASSRSSRRSKKESKSHSLSRPFRRTDPTMEEKKMDPHVVIRPPPEQKRTSGLVSFEDMLKTGRRSPETVNNYGNHMQPMMPSLDQPNDDSFNGRSHGFAPVVLFPEPNFNPDFNPALDSNFDDRPHRSVPKAQPTASEGYRTQNSPNHVTKVTKLPAIEDETFSNALEEKKAAAKERVTIEVKPLPKIRLSLMPSPREEDEENSSNSSPAPRRIRKKKKSSRIRSSSRKKSSRGAEIGFL